MEKTCSKCGEVKPLSKFGKHKGGAGGLQSCCKECNKAFSQQYREQNLEKVKKANRDFKRKARAEDPDKYRESQRQWYANNCEKCRARAKERVAANRFYYALKDSVIRAKKFGYMPCMATPEELEAAFDGRCAICGIFESDCKTRLHVDHSHQSGHFRGFLCNNCNRGLGHFKDSTEILASALHYLTNHQPQA